MSGHSTQRDTSPRVSTTRLAPSPTGALHLGNARTFLINWLLARQNGWRIVLRIEDIDGPRIKRGADQQAIEDLRWLGLDWDDGPIYQRDRGEAYNAAIEQLLKTGAAYPCVCSRREVELAASAPHAEDGAAVYPGTCRGLYSSVADAARASGRSPAIRFRVPDGPLSFEDRFAGAQRFDVATQLGDFVIAKGDDTPAYQLAVVVDDAEQGVDRVVRGNDLIDSTPRQMLLYRALSMVDQIPEYWHLPLIRGQDGRRLAKRHGDTRLASYRSAGVAASRVRALLARWCGMTDLGNSVSVDTLLSRFRLDQVSTQAIVFTARDEAFLRAIER